MLQRYIHFVVQSQHTNKGISHGFKKAVAITNFSQQNWDKIADIIICLVQK